MGGELFEVLTAAAGDVEQGAGAGDTGADHFEQTLTLGAVVLEIVAGVV